MASKAGIFLIQSLAGTLNPTHQHNPESAAPGLPVKADELIYQGVLVAYDPANSQAQAADPSMPATAKVIGYCEETVDNRDGAKGDKKISPTSGVLRVKSDGNFTAAHLYKQTRIIDDHTVGVPAGTDADRFAGLLIGLDGDYAWIVVAPELALRGPQTVTLTSANGTAGAAADLTALKAEAEKIGDDVRAVHAALVAAGILAPAAA